MPHELQRRETRLARIREAKQALEERAREKAKAAGKSEEEVNEAQPEDKSQYNFTDLESRIMNSSEGFVQAYNGQIAVEPEFQLIVGQFVRQAGNDKEQLQPMVRAIEERSGQLPTELLADAGYCSDSNLEYLESEAEPEKQIDAYEATGRQKHSEAPVECPRGPLPQGATRTDRMRRKCRRKLARRSMPTQNNRRAGVRPDQASARIPKVFAPRSDQCAVRMRQVCLTHNILKLHRICFAILEPQKGRGGVQFTPLACPKRLTLDCAASQSSWTC